MPAPDEHAGEDDAADDRESVAPPLPRPSGPLRYLFYLVWLVAVPLSLGLGTVWLLTPAASDFSADWFRTFVGEQQVPATILFFTLYAIVLWRFRYALPLARIAGVLARPDLPPAVRGRFDDAVQLVDEARRILRLREHEITRALSRQERDRLHDALDGLSESMTQVPLDEDVFREELSRAEKLANEHLSRWRKGEAREYGESIGIAILVALLLRVFVIEAFKIPSGSMIPTLMVGDHIFVAKYAYGPLLPFSDIRLYSRMPPVRGDVMVFKFPENKEQDFIKRVVAVPGDKLEALDGRVVINGWLAPHCYVGRLNQGHLLTGELYVEYLGERTYLTMFDQKTSEDSCNADADCGAGRGCRGHVCGSLQGPFYVATDEAWVMGDNRNNSHDSRFWRGGLGAGVPFRNIKGRAMFVWMAWNPNGGVATDRLFVSVMGQPRLPAGAPPSLQTALETCLRQRPAAAELTPPGNASN